MATAAAQLRSAPASQSRWRGAAVWTLAVVLLLAGGHFGLAGQHWLWNASEPIRFRYDIWNAYQQGWRAQQVGVFNVYRRAAENAYERSDGSLDYDVDYPPLRLVVAWLWSSWTAGHFDPAAGWQNTWEFHRPLLNMNRALLALAALSAMGLVLHFDRMRPLPGQRPRPPGRGAIRGAVAALLVWLSIPASLIGFAWPQWDIAVPAFFLSALLAGCRRWWIFAGVLLAIGGMYKGQTLVVLPLFAFWPLVAGEWRGLLRFILGFALAAGVIAAPFMLQSTLWAVGTLAGALFAIVGLGVLCHRAAAVPPTVSRVSSPGGGEPKDRPHPDDSAPLHRPRTSGFFSMSRLRWLLILPAAVAAATGASVAAWLTGAVAGITGALLAALIAAGLFFLAATLPRRDIPSLLAAAIASAIWLPACLTPEPWYWLDVGLLYGTRHFPAMIMGPASTFPAILAARFGIYSPDLTALTINGYDITWKLLLRTIFATGMVLCGIAMGIHHRRGNPRFLLAAVTPWLLFATIPAQIHERYPLYPALASAVLIALGLRWALVHLSLAAISGATVMLALLASGQGYAFLPRPDGMSWGMHLQQIVQPLHPEIAWAMLVLCGVCLWCALDVRRPATAPYHPLPSS